MIYVSSNKIKEVKKNLIIFDGTLKDNFVETLLKSEDILYDKHGLFFSLCNPKIFPLLKKSILAVKSYNGGKHFPKAVGKLVR